jgi:hypothetical protein
MLQLPSHHEYRIEHILHMWVSCICIFQNFTNEVYRLLFYFCVSFLPFNDDDCVGGCDIE